MAGWRAFRAGLGISLIVAGVSAVLGSPPAASAPPPTLPGSYVSLAPARLLAAGTTAGATTSLQVTGRGGVPATGVSAVVLNITAYKPTNSGSLTVYPTGIPRPPTSNLNFVPGQVVPNLVITPVGPDGK